MSLIPTTSTLAKSNKSNLIWLLLGAFIFNAIFWNEKMGVNTAIYGSFIIAVLFFLYPNARPLKAVRWLLAGHLLCLAMIIWHNTDLSKVAYIISFALLAAFAHFGHRSLSFAGGSILENILYGFPSLTQNLPSFKTRNYRLARIGKYFRYALIPLALTFLFFVIYNIANNAFSQVTVKVLDYLGNYLEHFFEFISFGRLMYFLFGLAITIVLLQKNRNGYFLRKEEKMNDEVKRNKVKGNSRNKGILFGLTEMFLGKMVSGVMALKHMNTIGVLSLILLNLLLAIANGIDISYLWFGFNSKGVNLYKLIHDGSDLLIVSILLAISVVIVFFKGNLNFYQKSKTLKLLAYLWLFQNIILVVSVFIRDYYYIVEAGLARKRIGILFYLSLVLFGLCSVFWKIYFKKSTYFLFRINAWAAFFLLTVSTTVNWDKLIVQHNLSRKDQIVLPSLYMTNLSTSVLPILNANRELLATHESLLLDKGFSMRDDCVGCAMRNLDFRIADFNRRQDNYTLLSWNKTDAEVKKQFQESMKDH